MSWIPSTSSDTVHCKGCGNVVDTPEESSELPQWISALIVASLGQAQSGAVRASRSPLPQQLEELRHERPRYTGTGHLQ
jgi:hypothetical protein